MQTIILLDSPSDMNTGSGKERPVLSPVARTVCIMMKPRFSFRVEGFTGSGAVSCGVTWVIGIQEVIRPWKGSAHGH
jgi:hypothetical protein